MSDWLNHAAVATPRNATTTHTLDATGTGGTVVSGAGFTPTSGRLLVCFANGGVTSTTPTGWTLPTNGSAINNEGFYVWWRSASGTSADQIATTHNAADYPVMFDFYEFPSGSTFVKSASAIAVASGGAGPTASTLTGTNWTAGALGADINGAGLGTVTWNLGTEIVDYVTGNVGATHGYHYGLTETNGNTATSAAYSATITSSIPSAERLVVAVSVAAGAAAKSRPIQRRPLNGLITR